MIKLLKMDLYRIVQGKALWILLVVVVASVAGSMALASFLSSPEFMQTMNNLAAESGSEPLATPPRTYPSPTGAFGSLLMGGLVSVMVAVAVALLVAADFDTGYVRNLFSAQRGRLSYFGAKMGMIILLTAIFVIVGMAATEVLRMAFGFTYENNNSVLDILIWFVMAVLTISAYAAIVAGIVWVTRSKAAGIATAIVVASGALESLLLQLLSPLFSSTGALSQVPEWLLHTQNSLVGSGAAALLATPFNAVRVAIVAIVIMGLCLAIGSAVASRRDA